MISDIVQSARTVEAPDPLDGHEKMKSEMTDITEAAMMT